MQNWEWEIFENYIKDGILEIIDAGPLFHPIKDLKISRDKGLGLIINTTCDLNAKTHQIDHPSGTVRKNDESLKLKSITGSIITISGVQPIQNQKITNYSSNKFALHETSSAHEISGLIRKKSKTKFIIEWIANIDNAGSPLWPDSISDDIKTDYNRTLGRDKKSIKIFSSSKSMKFARSCIGVKIDNNVLYIGTCESVGIDQKNKPGFILYEETMTEESRQKIRGAISFVFGRPIVYLGETFFNKKWQPIYFKAVSPNSMDGKAFLLNSFPLSPLATSTSNPYMDNKVVSKMITKFYHKYEDYDLSHVSWLYWYACASPSHIAASQFGATLEAIQRAFIKKHNSSFKTSLLDEESWSTIKNDMIITISKLEDKDAREVFKNKIENLNHSPQGKMAEQFLELTGLKLTRSEEAVFKQRHKSAHGAKTSDYIKLIKEVKILKLLCNRILLKITNANHCYIDYHTLGHPVKNTEESIIRKDSDHIGYTL